MACLPRCVGNIPRTLLMIPTWTYVKRLDGIYVNLFIGSTITVEDVAGTDVELIQKTDYPWSGRIAITESANPPAIHRLRPGAQSHHQCTLHGDPRNPGTEIIEGER